MKLKLFKHKEEKQKSTGSDYHIEAGRKGGKVCGVPKGFANPEVRAKAYATRKANGFQYPATRATSKKKK